MKNLLKIIEGSSREKKASGWAVVDRERPWKEEKIA